MSQFLVGSIGMSFAFTFAPILPDRIAPVMFGAIGMGFAVAGLFFLRFWRETRDRLFALFALAFFVLAVNRFGIALVEKPDSVRGDYLYWVRLVAFALILLAIVDKNRAQKKPSS